MLGNMSFADYIGNLFTRASSTYDEEEPKFFSYFGRKLAEFSPLSHDMNVLDLATGRGAVFYPVLEELSHMGCLIGLDISEGMVDQVNTELLAYRIRNAIVINMNAENLEFHDEFFDLITCGLSLSFFKNLSVVFTEIKRVLKYTGYFTFSTWMHLEHKQFDWYRNILNKYLPEEKFKSDIITEQNYEIKNDFSSTENLEKIVQANGFKVVKIASEVKRFMYPDAQCFWNKIWSHSERLKLEQIPEVTLSKFKKELFESFNKIKGPDGLEFDLGIIYVCCKK